MSIFSQRKNRDNTMKVAVSLVLLFMGQQARTQLEIPSCPEGVSECINNEDHAKAYVDLLDYEFVRRAVKSNLAEWAYATNITDENAEAKVRFCLAKRTCFKICQVWSV